MFRFQVLIESKDDGADALPHLIYVAREKRPTCPHHFKAGAMNVLVKDKHNEVNLLPSPNELKEL